MRVVESIPVFDGNAWSSIVLTRREAEAATWGERSGFVVVDHRTSRLGALWFLWCEARDRPAIFVERRKHGRAEVSVDLLSTGRCLTLAGWRAVVDAFERHGSKAMRRVHGHGLAFVDFAFGVVAWPEADRLARELLAITNAGSFMRGCHRIPEGAVRR